MRGEINLLPAEYRKKPFANHGQLVTAVLIIGTLFVMVYYGFGVIGVERSNLKLQINQVNNELSNLQEGIQKYEQKIAQNKILSTNKSLAESLEKEILPVTPVLKEMDKIIPSGVVLINSETTVDEISGSKNVLIIKGNAVSFNAIADYVDRLNSSGHYRNARLLNIKEKAPDIKSWDFEISCLWQKGGDQ